MAGVFGLIRVSQRRLVGRHGVIQREDPRALELQAAMEILAEVFDIEISDVDEMLRLRSEDREMWPREFCL
jgi:hypothetical protein